MKMGTTRLEAVVEFDYVANEADELTIKKGDVITDIKTQPGGWWEGTLGGKRGMFPDNFVKVVSETPDSRMSNDVSLRPVRGRKCKVLFSYAPVNDDELELQVDDVIHIISEVEEGWWRGRLRDKVGVFPSNFVKELEDKTEVTSSHSLTSTASLPTTTATTTTSITSSIREQKIGGREEASESEGELSTSVSSPDSSQLLDSTGKSDQDADTPVLPPKPVKEICRVLFPYEAANDDELTLKEGDLITLLSRDVQDKGWWRGELKGRIGVFPDNFVEVLQQEELPKKSERPPMKAQTATTNRVRDSITKPLTPSGLAKVESVDQPVKKLGEIPAARSEDRTSVVPPIPGKKPQLPPPIKKPQRLSGMFHSSLRQDSTDQRLNDTVDGAGSSKPNRPPQPVIRDEVPEFDSIERSAMLVHPTASRARAPRRRLPTSFSKQSDQHPVGMMNGSADIGHNDLENSQEDSDEKDEGGTKSWAGDKNKVPWLEELMINQARKNTPGPRSFLSPRSPTPSQTSPKAASHSPEQQDKKGMLPTSKIKAEQGALKPAVPQDKQVTKSKKPTAADATPGVTLRHTSTTRTLPFSSSTGHQRPFSMGASGISTDMHWFTSESSSLTSSKSTTITQATSSSSGLASTKSADSSPAAPTQATDQNPATGGLSATVSTKQLLELKERVVKLEQNLAEQRELFTKTVKEFMDKLNEEVARRKQIEQELDKLINLVTQV